MRGMTAFSIPGDGETIFWRDGPRPLTVDEILALVGKPIVKESNPNKINDHKEE